MHPMQMQCNADVANGSLFMTAYQIGHIWLHHETFFTRFPTLNKLPSPFPPVMSSFLLSFALEYSSWAQLYPPSRLLRPQWQNFIPYLHLPTTLS